MSTLIRPALAADLSLIVALIRELAEYEHLAHEVRLDEATLEHFPFG
jgi:hypothetical protein